MDDLEWFQKGTRPQPNQAAITLQKKGPISLTKAAYQLMGEPTAVELGYSKSRNVIAFRPSDPRSPTAAAIRKVSDSDTYIIAAAAFTAHYGLRRSQAQRFPLEKEGDLFIADLSGPAEKPLTPRLRNREVNVGAGNERANGG